MGFAPLCLRSVTLDWSRTYVVGVVNVTPDSFSDGGRYDTLDAAVAHAETLVAAGADILDVGGEATGPRAVPVSDDLELERIVPVLERLSERVAVPLSIDTTKATVARAAVAAGAEIVNDVSGGLFDAEMVATVAELDAVYVCSHLRGTSIADVHRREGAPPSFDEVVNELRQRVDSLPDGVRRRTIADPGIGFGKPPELNVELLRRVDEIISRVDCPLMVGPSRKRFLGVLTGEPTERRDAATVGAALASVAGGAHLVRVHCVEALKAALVVYEAIRA